MCTQWPVYCAYCMHAVWMACTSIGTFIIHSCTLSLHEGMQWICSFATLGFWLCGICKNGPRQHGSLWKEANSACGDRSWLKCNKAKHIISSLRILGFSCIRASVHHASSSTWRLRLRKQAWNSKLCKYLNSGSADSTAKSPPLSLKLEKSHGSLLK